MKSIAMVSWRGGTMMLKPPMMRIVYQTAIPFITLAGVARAKMGLGRSTSVIDYWY